LTVMVGPSGSHEANGVSQKPHRKLHPLVRMKILGVPVSAPSPWSERYISEIRIRGYSGAIGVVRLLRSSIFGIFNV